MTFDGVTAVQARIAQIQQLVTATVSGAGGPSAAAPAPGSAQSPEFASLLADAMATDTSSSDPLSDSPSAAGGTNLGGSPMLSQILQLAQLGSGASTSTTPNLSNLVGADPTPAALGDTGNSTSLASILAGLTGTSAATGATTNATTNAFLTNALGQQGKPYVYGATAKVTDPNPTAFDCSELTKWAAARAGDPIPDGATAQYLYVRDHGDTMTVQQALHTPGALLFHFSHEPKNLGDIPADGHVAISLGDGVHTIEARGHAYGTNVFDNAAGRDFNFAGMIPGMS